MGSSIFEQLANELTTQEKQDLLAKIRDHSDLGESALHDEIEQKEIDLESIYEKTGFLERFWLYLLHLFQGRDVLDLLEERQIKSIYRDLKQNDHGWIDLEHNILTNQSYEILFDLNKRLDTVRADLNRCFRDRDEFINFWAMRHFSIQFKEFLQQIDPWKIANAMEETRVNKVKDEMSKRFNNFFDAIPSEMKILFRQQSDALYQLNYLANFPFYSILTSFSEKNDQKGLSASIEEIKSPLMTLADILYSFTLFPESNLLETILLFSNRERILDESNQDTAKWMEQQFSNISGIKVILKKMNQIPLALLLKAVNKNINYKMNNLGGSEDYFFIFKKGWQNKMDQLFTSFVNRFKIRELVSGLLGTWSKSKLAPLGRYNEGFSNSRSFRYKESLQLIYEFYQDLIKEKSYPCLDIIWKRGEFYKKDNAIQFKQVMETIYSSVERVKELLEKLENNGFYHVRYKEILLSDNSEDQRERDISFLYQNIDQEVRGLLDFMLLNLHLLGKLLTGILIGDRGEYDTLSNYADLAGPPNRLFKDELITREFLVNNAYKMLSEIIALEEKSPL